MLGNLNMMLCLVNTEEGTAVKEPNNSFETANPLSLNILLRGTLSDQDQG